MLKLCARGCPQPVSLHACTRTRHRPKSATVIVVLEDEGRTPSFSSLPGPAARQRTQYSVAPSTSSQSTSTFSEPAVAVICSPLGLAGTLVSGSVVVSAPTKRA